MTFDKSPPIGRQFIATLKPGRSVSFKDVMGLSEYGLSRPQGPTHKGFDIRLAKQVPFTESMLYILGDSHFVFDIKNGLVHADLYTCRGESDGQILLDTLKEGLDAKVLKMTDMHVVVDPEQMDYNQLLHEKHWFSLVLTGVKPDFVLNSRQFCGLLEEVYGDRFGGVPSVFYHDFEPGLTTGCFFNSSKGRGYATSHSYISEYGTLYLGGYRLDHKDITPLMVKLVSSIGHERVTAMRPLGITRETLEILAANRCP